jgi:hypothetical protein
MVVRSTVKPHEKSPEESSEDRQSTASRARIARGEVGAEAPPVGAGVALAGGTVNPTAGPSNITPVTSPSPLGRGAAIERDPEEDWDGCDVEAEGITSDEALPPAHGGVA